MMPRNPTPDGDGKPTRERLLLASLKTFGHKDYEAVSTREIVELAQANISAISYHFGGKDNLYVEAFRAMLGPLRDQGHPAVRAGFDSLAILIAALGTEHGSPPFGSGTTLKIHPGREGGRGDPPGPRIPVWEPLRRGAPAPERRTPGRGRNRTGLNRGLTGRTRPGARSGWCHRPRRECRRGASRSGRPRSHRRRSPSPGSGNGA